MDNLARKSFVLHFDSLKILDKFNDKQAGQFIKAIYQYQTTGILPKLDFALDIALTPFVNQFIRDDIAYLEKIEKLSTNGKKGGRPKTKKANGFIEKQQKAKKADSVNANNNSNVINRDNKNVIDNDIGIENEKLFETFGKFNISKKLKNKILEFMEYREEISKPYKSQKSINALIEKLAEKSEDIAIKEINQSIANGWQGIFEVQKTKSTVKDNKYEPKSSNNNNNLNF